MNKISKFIFYCFTVSWLSWGLLAYITKTTDVRMGHPIFLALFIAGGLGPTIAAFLSMHSGNNPLEYRMFIRQIFKAKVNILWYVFVFNVPFALFSIPFLINMNSVRAEAQLFHRPIYFLLTLMFTNIIFGGLEEIGWRGVLLPQLIKNFPTGIATLITSLIWSFWHLPLWFINSSPQQNISPLVFVILGLCFSLILTVIYSNTESIFLCIIAHSLINSYSGIITMPFTNLFLELTIMLAFSLVVYLIFMNINRHKSKTF